GLGLFSYELCLHISVFTHLCYCDIAIYHLAWSAILFFDAILAMGFDEKFIRVWEYSTSPCICCDRIEHANEIVANLFFFCDPEIGNLLLICGIHLYSTFAQ
ncbi:hypothetical protein ACJX0J_031817, partial [Zea mays]